MKLINHIRRAVLAMALSTIAPTVTLAADTQPVTIRFAELGTIGVGNLYQYLALEKGVYQAHGIDLQIVHFLKGGPESVAAAASNQVDMGSVGAPIVTAISRGVHLKIVGSPAIHYNTFILVARPGIHSVAELKGKDVAFGDPGGGSVIAARYIFLANKVDPESIHNVGGGGTSSYLALKNGRIDAAILGEPNVTLAEKLGVGKVLARAEDYLGNYELSYIYATQKFIDAHPDAIRRFFVANREAIRYAKEHPDELYAFGRRKINLDPVVLQEAIARQVARWDDSGRISEPGLLTAVKVAQTVGDISPDFKPNIADMTDFRFLKASDAEFEASVSASPKPAGGQIVALSRKK